MECLFCKEEFVSDNKRAKYCDVKCKKAAENARKRAAREAKRKAGGNVKTVTCGVCDEKFQTEARSAKYCGDDCKRVATNLKQNARKAESYSELPDIVECRICNVKLKNLTGHIKKIHGITTAEYQAKYGGKVLNEKITSILSENMCGEKNPAYNHGGKMSPWSEKSEYHSSEVIEESRRKAYSKHTKDKRDVCAEYHGYQGLEPEAVQELISERQRTFTLEKCIEQHGEDKGREVHAERQRKWLKSMPRSNFSKISQQLFWEITKFRGTEGIYFAELSPEKKLDDSGKNNEATITLSETSCKPDYLCIKTKRVIEFDGDYWHGAMGNIERERKRDESLCEMGYQVLHLREKDYRADPQKIIKECVEFLNE